MRLENGEVASVPISDVNANRAAYTRAVASRADLPFDAHPRSGHRILILATTRVDEVIEPAVQLPSLTNEAFEEQIATYLKETQEWERADAPPAHERHFLRKKRRAAYFESKQ
ncbi:MAG: hypothetical protein M3Z35_06845 [Nitrospirota bacterium]|nr:hypothetical protein [Nitrospirota bacterium]